MVLIQFIIICDISCRGVLHNVASAFAETCRASDAVLSLRLACVPVGHC